MNYIYLVTNKENGKQYIGQTTYDVKTRWRNHVYHSEHSLDNNYFHRAIRKYGEKSFEISIVEEIEDYNLLDEREIFYISFYNTLFPNGYNLALGGNGVRRYDYMKIWELWESGLSIKEICEKFPARRETIINILKDLPTYSSEEAFQRGLKVRKVGRKVRQYTKENIFIKEYPSVRAAASAIGVSDSAIASSIKRNGCCNGYKWQYVDVLARDS